MPLFIVMSKLGWTGNLLAVIVPGLVTAFGVFWMTQYLENALPYELIEAARVDGCSMLRTFWQYRAAGGPTGGHDARVVHVYRQLDELLLAVHRARLVESDTAGEHPTSAGVLLQGLLAHPGWRDHRRSAAARCSSRWPVASWSLASWQGAVKG
ncbi:MAG: ABC transporter permease subunit [Dermatophilaceae bacterium]